jgi:hypothetical protein
VNCRIQFLCVTVSQKLSLPLFFFVNGGSWRQENARICFGHKFSILPPVPKIVQALVTMHNGISQTLAAQGDVLLLKPFLDFGFNGVVRWKSTASEIIFQFAKHVEVYGGRVGAVRCVGGWGVQKWLQEQDVSLYLLGLGNLIVRCDKCLDKFGDCVEKYRTDVQRYPCIFLVSTYPQFT